MMITFMVGLGMTNYGETAAMIFSMGKRGMTNLMVSLETIGFTAERATIS